MHELSIALSILDIAAEESERRGGATVNAIHIRLGPLSGVVKEALVPAFELARECSPFVDCQLVIEDVPVVVYCQQCQDRRPVESVQLICCSECGTPAADLISGREMEVTAMEITTVEPERPGTSHTSAGPSPGDRQPCPS